MENTSSAWGGFGLSGNRHLREASVFARDQRAERRNRREEIVISGEIRQSDPVAHWRTTSQDWNNLPCVIGHEKVTSRQWNHTIDHRRWEVGKHLWESQPRDTAEILRKIGISPGSSEEDAFRMMFISRIEGALREASDSGSWGQLNVDFHLNE